MGPDRIFWWTVRRRAGDDDSVAAPPVLLKGALVADCRIVSYTRGNMTNETTSYREALLRDLTNPVEAEHYLNAVLEDYPEGFLKALRNVAQARQMAKVAQDAGIQRESLYRALSEDGNPTLETLTAVLEALGLRLAVASQHKAA